MRATTLKTITWSTIVIVVLTGSFVVNTFVTRPIAPDSNIPPVLEARNSTTHVLNTSCDPLVIAMDATGNVYSGRDRIGNLANILDLKTKLEQVIASRGLQKIYAGEMDLNHEIQVPLCPDYQLFIKTPGDANESLTSHLIRVLTELGIHPHQVIKDNRKT